MEEKRDKINKIQSPLTARNLFIKIRLTCVKLSIIMDNLWLVLEKHSLRLVGKTVQLLNMNPL